MGRKTANTNAVYIDDQARCKIVTLKLDRITSDDELPTLRRVLEKIGINLTDYPAKPDPDAEPLRYYPWDGGDLLIRDLDRKVIRGENIRWGLPNNSGLVRR